MNEQLPAQESIGRSPRAVKSHLASAALGIYFGSSIARSQDLEGIEFAGMTAACVLAALAIKGTVNFLRNPTS